MDSSSAWRLPRGWTWVFVAGVLLLFGHSLLSSTLAANPATITLDAHPIAADGTIRVEFQITPPANELVGEVLLDVSFDPMEITSIGCTPASQCNLSFGSGVARIQVGPNLAGLSGPNGSVTFEPAPGSAGTDVTIGVELIECLDPNGQPLNNCTSAGTTVSVPSPTPSPTPTLPPTPTPTFGPTETPAPNPTVMSRRERGDLNCDGVIDDFDLVRVLRGIVGLGLVDYCNLFSGSGAWDIDCDGAITGVDALDLAAFIVGISRQLGEGCDSLDTLVPVVGTK